MVSLHQCSTLSPRLSDLVMIELIRHAQNKVPPYMLFADNIVDEIRKGILFS